MNRRVIITVLLIGVFVLLTKSDQCPGIAFEGSSYTFERVVEYSSIAWQYTDNIGDAFALTCQFQPYKCKDDLDEFSGNITGIGSPNSDGLYESYKATMTIKNVTRDRDTTTWKWTSMTYVSSSDHCDLEVYSIPRPICDKLHLAIDETKMTWTCRVSKVYPQPSCQMEYKENNNGYKIVSMTRITTTTGKLSGQPPYYELNTCTMTIPMSVPFFTARYRYQFRATIFAQGYLGMGKTTESNILTFNQCPNIAIEGSSYKFRKVVDYSTIVWQYSTKVGLTCQFKPYKCNDPAGLFSGSITGYNSPGPDGLYKFYKATMTIKNVTRHRDATTWIWEPENYDSTGSRQCDLEVYVIKTPVCGKLQLSNDNTKVTWTCSVSNVYPQTECRMEYKKNNEDYKTVSASSITKTTGTLSGKPPYYDINSCIMNIPTNIPAFTAGTYKFRATLFPLGFIEMGKTAESSELTILPPPNPPIMTINGRALLNDETVTVLIAGDQATVKCRVANEDPAVSKVTILCAGHTIDQYKPLQIDKSMNQKKCVCSDEHGEKSEVTLNVRYKPNVIAYMVNSVEGHTMEVDAEKEAIFTCKVEGNPYPQVSIVGPDSSVNLIHSSTIIQRFVQSVGSKTMMCRDTGLYTCKAKNYVGNAEEKSLKIFVKCSPELVNKSSDGDTHTVSIGTNYLDINTPIIGYPTPTTFTLYKVVSEYTNTDNLITIDNQQVEKLDKNSYMVKYISYNDGKGTVKVTREIISGQYVMAVENGVGDGLTFKFNVINYNENAEEHKSSESLSAGEIVGISISACVFAIICLIILIKVCRRRC